MAINGVASSDQSTSPFGLIEGKVGKFFKRPVQQIDSNITAFIKELPQDGFVDLGEFLNIQPKIRHWNENIELHSDKLGLSHMLAVAARLVATLTLGRVFCTLGACYHGFVGACKLALVVLEYRTEDKEKMALIFKNAVHHFLLALYNGVASFSAANYLIAGAYSVAPQWVEEQHVYFAGTEEIAALEKRLMMDATRKELEALGCPQFDRVIGACIDAGGPYGEDGLPADLPKDRKSISVISRKASEISKEWLGHLEQWLEQS